MAACNSDITAPTRSAVPSSPSLGLVCTGFLTSTKCGGSASTAAAKQLPGITVQMVDECRTGFLTSTRCEPQ
jgi:hypothetical protein